MPSAVLRRASIAGAFVIALTSMFNDKAEAKAPAMPQGHTFNIIPQSRPDAYHSLSLRTALGQVIVDTVRNLDHYYTSPENAKADDPVHNPYTEKAIATVLDLLEQGADPNYIEPKTGISAFAWGVWMAYELDRPDVVEAFLNHGADVKQSLSAHMPLPQAERNSLKEIPMQNPHARHLTMVDQAARAMIESQFFARTHMQTAAKILRLLKDKGAGIDDLQTMATVNGTGYESLAVSPVGVTVLIEEGLAPGSALDPMMDKVMGLSPELKAALNQPQTIDRAFLARYKAPLHDYPDAIPGGKKPYTVKAGDTVQSLATRFRHAMGVGTDNDAVKALAALPENKIVLDGQGKVLSALTPKAELYIPMSPNHIIGTMAIVWRYGLTGVAERLMTEMGAQNMVEAANTLVEQNIPGLSAKMQARSISPEDVDTLVQSHFKIGARVHYKTAGGLTRTARIMPIDVLSAMASGMVKSKVAVDPHGSGDDAPTPERMLELLIQVNALDRHRLETDPHALKDGQELTATFYNDNYSHLDPLTPPATYDPSQKVSLIVVENGKNPETDKSAIWQMHGAHEKRTFGDAASAAYGIDPHADLSNVYAVDDVILGFPGRDNISDATSLMLNGAGGHDKIFSISMVEDAPFEQQDKLRHDMQRYHSGAAALRMVQDRIEQSRPIIFGATGNARQSINELPNNNGDGRYRQSWALTHSPDAVNVGAAGDFRVSPEGATTVALYSGYGGDICDQLPYFMGEEQQGTSFSTPDLAGLTKQMMEWYGDKLTFEEILTAAMMTANRNIMDFDPRYGLIGMDESGVHSVPAIFHTNGGGIPMHDRCGAGVIDRHSVSRWNDIMKHMVELKDQRHLQDRYLSSVVELKEPVEIHAPETQGGKTRYVYQMRVPHDMTLDKLTFVLPLQDNNPDDEVHVRTPAGFEMILPLSDNNIVSSRALTGEDVHEGDTITITTPSPLYEEAAVYVRGHAFGNVIQAVRDELRQQGVLKPPGATVIHGQVVDHNPDPEGQMLGQPRTIQLS